MVTQLTGSALRLDNLSKSYSHIHSVKQVSASIPAGQFFSLLGPSGCGKTTTLMMVAGFIKPSHGRIYLDGKDLTDAPPEKRGIGMVFQNYAIFPHLTVFENVAYPLRVRGVSGTALNTRVAEALEMVRLNGYQSRSPRELSGGEMQRVALARSIVFKPGILLMDEPLGALDKNLREHMHGELKRIQQDLGATVVYVTHDQEEALKMSDVIAVMSKGIVQQLGSPLTIYNNPANSFVAEFIGTTNTVLGVVETITKDGSVGVKTPVGLVWGIAADDVRAGSKVKVCVRPQNLTLSNSAGDAQSSSIPVSIETKVFTGEIVQYRLRTAGDLTLSAHQHATWGAANTNENKSLYASWPQQAARVFVG